MSRDQRSKQGRRSGSGEINIGFGLETTSRHPVSRRSRRKAALRAVLYRINRRAGLLILGLVLLMAASYYPLKWRQDGILRRSALAQARQLSESHQLDKAMVNVEHYLADWPDDLDGLELMGELLAKNASSADQILRGIKIIDHLLKLDPEPKDRKEARQEDRKRLVLLSIRLSDIIRASSDKLISGMDKFESRYRFANSVAEQRIKLGADDGASHRLLATTLERLYISGDEAAGPRAIKEYQIALRKDPGDCAAAEQLASLRLNRKEQAGADKILDDLLKHQPRSVEARLVRARHFVTTGRDDRAKIEADAASKLAPTDYSVRIMAASIALQRGTKDAAKAHLAAVPESKREGARVAILLCQLELLDRRPDEAVKKLREGLVRSLGTDSELAWRLALTLIQLGRSTEARPVIAQYRRLCGRDDHPMLRFLRGTLLEKSGRPAAAIVELEPARDGIPEEWLAELEVTLGRCHEAVGEQGLAQAAYTTAKNKAPNSTAARSALARILRATNNEDKAFAELEEGIRRKPDSSLHIDLINAMVSKQMGLPPEKRNWTGTELAIDRALRAKIIEPGVTRARVEMMLATGRTEEAGKVLEEATKGEGRNLEENWLARAQFLKSQGRIDEALKILDQGSAPGAVGPRVSLRVARSELLARSGHGRAGLELLAIGIEKCSVHDRAILAKAKAEMLLNLGDRAGARAAFDEWATLSPENIEPGLRVIDMARKGGNAEDLDQGIELLRKAGGEDEPVALIAQAFGILLPPGGDEAVDPARLDLADSIKDRLDIVAPKLPVTALVRAILLERSSAFEEAIADYRVALVGDKTGLALSRLVALLTRLKRTDDLNALKQEGSSASTIDRITVVQSLGSGDKEQAETLLAQLVESDPDRLDYRAEQAKLLRAMGKADQAEAKIKEIVDRRPELPQPWLALLAIQLERGDKAAAKATVERLKVAYKGERPDLLLIRGLWSIGDRESALKVCGQELSKRPTDIASIRVASEIEEAVGRNDRAEVLLSQALKIEPKLGWARRRLALLLSLRPGHGRWAEARAMVSNTGSASTDSPEDRMVRATVLVRGPDPSHKTEAIAVFRSIADDLPSSNLIGRSARLELTKLLMANSEPAEAAKAIAPATSESAAPEPSTLAMAIEALVQDEKVEEARRLLDRLIKAEPEAPMTTVCRALVLKGEGDNDAATSLIVEAAAAAEKSPNGERLNRYYFEQLARLGSDAAAETMARNLASRWPAQGIALVKFLAAKGRFEEAIDACNATVEAGYPRDSIRVLLSLVNQKRIEGPLAEKAIGVAQSASARSPKDIDLMSMVATILRARHQFEDEASLYRKLLEVDPANDAVRNNLAWVLSHDLGRPADGLVEIDRVIRQTGEMPQVIDTRSMILVQLGRTDEAIADLERVAKADPSPLRHIHLARAYAKAGRNEDRRREREAAKLVAVNLGALDPEDRAELETVNP